MGKAKAEVAPVAPVRREGIVPNPKKKLLDQVREGIRLKHGSIRTEQTSVGAFPEADRKMGAETWPQIFLPPFFCQSVHGEPSALDRADKAVRAPNGR